MTQTIKNLRFYKIVCCRVVLFVVFLLFFNLGESQNNLYVEQDGVLFRVDYDNCELIEVIETNLSDVEPDPYYWADLSFDTEGNLYFIEGRGQVYHIDTITGILTPYFKFENEPYQYLSGLTIDYKGIFYGIGWYGDVYAYDPTTSTTVRHGPYSNELSGMDITFYNGKLFFFTVTNPRILLEAEFGAPENSKEIMSLGIFGPGGLSTYADSCQSYFINGSAARRDPYTFGLIYPYLDSIDFRCLGIYPKPALGTSGSAYRYEHLASMPPVDIDLEETVINSVDPCTGEVEVRISASGGIDSILYSLGGERYSYDSVFVTRDTGWVELFVKDSRSCYWTDSLYLPPPPYIDIDSIAVRSTSCDQSDDGGVSIYASGGHGGLSFALEDNDYLDHNVFDQLLQGEYSFSIKDSLGCVVDSSFSVSASPVPEVVISSHEEYCLTGDGAITVSIPDQLSSSSFSIDGDDFQSDPAFDGLSAGNYTLFVNYNSECQFQYPFVVDRTMDTTYMHAVDSSCIYDQIEFDTLRLSNAFGCDSIVYMTYVPADFITVLSQSYDCQAQSAVIDSSYVAVSEGCDTLFVHNTLPAHTHEAFISIDTCSQSSVSDTTLTLTNIWGCDSLVHISYNAMPVHINTIDSIVCNHLPPDTVHFYNQFGCDSLIVLQFLSPDLSVVLPADTTILDGHQVTISPSIIGDYTSLLWEPDFINNTADLLSPTFTPDQSVTIALTATSPEGCAQRDVMTITVIEDTRVFIPNSFSPNSDGINDSFEIYLPQDSPLQLVDFEIYDRWGSRLFRCSGTNCTWDGTVNGQDCSPDTYIYQIRLQNQSNEVSVFSGEVVLMR